MIEIEREPMAEYTIELQSGDPLDMAELAEACVASGFPSVRLLERGRIGGLLPSYRCFVWQPGITDEVNVAELGVSLRQAVRRIAPGSSVRPLAHHQKNIWLDLRDADGNLLLPSQVLAQASEIDCWALGLVALFRAGMLPEVPSRG